MHRHGMVLVVAVFLFTSTSAWAYKITKDNVDEVIPNLEMDMTGQEYASLLNQMSALSVDGQKQGSPLQVVLDMGKRNLDWLKFINDNRDEQHKISFSSAATQMGSPIETPRFYNPTLIDKDYQALMVQVPSSIKNVVLGTAAFPVNPPLSDDQYIDWGRKLDRSYQLAARWILMQDYLPSMAQRKSEDIRGYYYLGKNPNIKTALQNWGQLSSQNKTSYTEYLTEMCFNNSSVNNCGEEVASAISQNKVFELYQSYLSASKILWDNFFTIQANRPDVKWNHNPEEAHVPFRDPNNVKVKNYLADNIQDEWKWNGWHLILDFQNGTQDIPEVTFQAGSTPHVNGIAGNVITMDDNAPLTEYDVQWTIRHEFGHVMGFPDCYVEFYDEPNSVMISYQLDITNLMCSRRGHFQQGHFEEVQRVYGSGIKKH